MGGGGLFEILPSEADDDDGDKYGGAEDVDVRGWHHGHRFLTTQVVD